MPTCQYANLQNSHENLHTNTIILHTSQYDPNMTPTYTFTLTALHERKLV